jgi:hypothetical protein
LTKNFSEIFPDLRFFVGMIDPWIPIGAEKTMLKLLVLVSGWVDGGKMY